MTRAKSPIIEVTWKELFFDPNNPRTRGPEQIGSPKVRFAAIGNGDVQKLARETLLKRVAPTAFGNLKARLVQDGWSPDAVLTVATIPGGYVLSDGNTRLAGIQDIIAIGAATKEVLNSFDHIRVIVVPEYEGTAWRLAQTRRHISREAQWTAANKATFAYELLSSGVGREEAVKKHGLSESVVATAQRAMPAFLDLMQRYPGRTDSSSHFLPVCQAVGSEKVRLYLGYNPRTKKFTTQDHLDQFIELLSPRSKNHGHTVINSHNYSRMLNFAGNDPEAWDTLLNNSEDDMDRRLKLVGNSRTGSFNANVSKLLKQTNRLKAKEVGDINVTEITSLIAVLRRILPPTPARTVSTVLSPTERKKVTAQVDALLSA